MPPIEALGKSKGVTLADLKDNEPLIMGLVVALYLKYGVKQDWITALGAGAAVYYVTDKSRTARAVKALHSQPYGVEARLKKPIAIVPKTTPKKEEAKK